MPATRNQSKRHYAIRIGLVLLIMFDTLRRSFLHHDAFDYTMLAVEVLVLLFIGIEAGIGIWRHFRVGHRKKRLRQYLIEGQALQTVDVSSHQREELAPWIAQVDTWINTTGEYLKKYSLEGTAAFLHDDTTKTRDSRTHFVGVSPFASHTFAILQQRLDNLRDILRNPDVYL
jgi:hypothetical protein